MDLRSNWLGHGEMMVIAASIDAARDREETSRASLSASSKASFSTTQNKNGDYQNDTDGATQAFRRLRSLPSARQALPCPGAAGVRGGKTPSRGRHTAGEFVLACRPGVAQALRKRRSAVTGSTSQAEAQSQNSDTSTRRLPVSQL